MTNLDDIQPGDRFLALNGRFYQALGTFGDGDDVIVRCLLVRKDGSVGTKPTFFLADKVVNILSKGGRIYA
jgi:hypothetical protein